MTSISERQDMRVRLEREPVAHLAEWLVSNLGPRLTAFATGVPTVGGVDQIAHGETPDAGTERRVRNLYAVAWLLSVEDGPGSAHAWLIEPNSELDDRAPAEVLHADVAPESVWIAAAPHL